MEDKRRNQKNISILLIRGAHDSNTYFNWSRHSLQQLELQ